MSKITLKNKTEIAIMRQTGSLAAKILKTIQEKSKPGITTQALDDMASNMIEKAGAKPSFKGFGGYPSTLCISINSEVVHGIPGSRRLEVGDIVGVDIGIFLKGYHVDTAITFGVEKISDEAQKLIETTKLSLENSLKLIRPGIHLGDVQAEIQKTIENKGFSVIKDLSGHGVGKNLQEEPAIPNYGRAGMGIILEKGMTLAIEPMVAAGDWHVRVKADGWTVEMVDGSLAAHFEHTIAVTDDGYEILTQ